MMLQVEIFRRELTPDERQIRDLNLRATALKKDDIHTAVDCLRSAQTLARNIDAMPHPIAWWLRLPVFLQQAGNMAAAEIEFNRIEQDIRGGFWAGHGSQASRAYLRALEDKRRVAHEREARTQAKPAKSKRPQGALTIPSGDSLCPR